MNHKRISSWNRGFVSVPLLAAIIFAVLAIGAAAFLAGRSSAPAVGSGQGWNISGPRPSIDEVMRQIGCSDETACTAVCTAAHPPAECAELETLMRQQGTWPAGHVDGSEVAATNGKPPVSGASEPPAERGAPSGRQEVAYTGDGTATNAGALPDCPADTNAFFDTNPLGGDLANIIPLGNMNGAHILPNQADHVYFVASSPAATKVYAPGKATLLQVVTQVDLTNREGNKATIFFSPCKSVMFAYQFDSLSPELAQAIAGRTPDQVQEGSVMRNTVYGGLSIPITSGEELGTIAGMNGIAGELDFAAADVRTPSWQFIDQGEATGMIADSYLHAVCPLDYFSNSMRLTLRSMLTAKNSGANGIPACGAIMQDKAGTAQGNWYKLGTSPRNGLVLSDLLALVHSNLDPTQGVASFGTALAPSPWSGTQIVFSPTHDGVVNREPSEITADGKVYCFNGPAGAGGQGSEGHLNIQMTSVTELKAEYGAGACAPAPALSNPITYER